MEQFTLVYGLLLSNNGFCRLLCLVPLPDASQQKEQSTVDAASEEREPPTANDGGPGDSDAVVTPLPTVTGNVVESRRLWPALRFDSFADLIVHVESSCSDAVAATNLKGKLTAQYQKLLRAQYGKQFDTAGHGVAYLLYRGSAGGTIVIVPKNDGGDEPTFDFFAHCCEMEYFGKDCPHVGSEEFQNAFRKVSRRIEESLEDGASEGGPPSPAREVVMETVKSNGHGGGKNAAKRSESNGSEKPNRNEDGASSSSLSSGSEDEEDGDRGSEYEEAIAKTAATAEAGGSELLMSSQKDAASRTVDDGGAEARCTDVDDVRALSVTTAGTGSGILRKPAISHLGWVGAAEGGAPSNLGAQTTRSVVKTPPNVPQGPPKKSSTDDAVVSSDWERRGGDKLFKKDVERGEGAEGGDSSSDDSSSGDGSYEVTIRIDTEEIDQDQSINGGNEICNEVSTEKFDKNEDGDDFSQSANGVTDSHPFLNISIECAGNDDEEAQIEETGLKEESAKSINNVDEEGQGMSPSGDPEYDDNGWNCGNCTLLNPEKLSACEVCGTLRRAKPCDRDEDTGRSPKRWSLAAEGQVSAKDVEAKDCGASNEAGEQNSDLIDEEMAPVSTAGEDPHSAKKPRADSSSGPDGVHPGEFSTAWPRIFLLAQVPGNTHSNIFT